MSLGALAQAVYEEFRHYRPKDTVKPVTEIDETPSSRIFVCIDKISLPGAANTKKALIQVVQGKHTLYLH